jgi:hypothetical protein
MVGPLFDTGEVLSSISSLAILFFYNYFFFTILQKQQFQKNEIDNIIEFISL